MEWLFGILFTMVGALYGQIYHSLRCFSRKVRDVEKHILTLRENDLHHIDMKIDKINSKLFELAGRK